MAKQNSNARDRKNNSKAGKLGADGVTGGVLGENIHFNKTLQKTLDDGVKDVVDQAQRYADNPAPSQAGFVAEADQCATFNARKALERDGTRAVRQPNGNHGDIKIVKGDKVVAEAEVKFHGTAEKTENAMRGYDDQQLVGPKDQLDDIQEIAKRKAAKNGASDNPSRRQVGKEHEAVAENASDSITDGKTQSTPRSRKEAEKIADDATKGKVGHETTLPPLKESLETAAKSGAKSGAMGGVILGGGLSAIGNVKAYVDGDKDGAEALADTAVDVGKAAADGAMKGAAGSAATVVATRVAAKVASPVLKTVLRSGGPAAVVVGGVDVVKHTIDLARGEIDGEEFVEATARTAVQTGGGYVGAQGGMLLGAFLGPVGVLLGGAIGGIGGALLGGSLFD